MATFHGTVQEFHHFIGPRLRNSISNWTRKHRNDKKGVCEMCGNTAELQSAHVHGRDRRTLIENVLAQYKDSHGAVSCSLEQVEEEILRAHEPIEATFKFICHPCHVQYDSSDSPNQINVHTNKTTNSSNFKKLSRIKRWADRPQQINHQIIQGYLALEKKGGVTLSQLRYYCETEFKLDKFDSNFVSMKTDNGNSHGNVFYEDNGLVKIWDTVRKEIAMYFK